MSHIKITVKIGNRSRVHVIDSILSKFNEQEKKEVAVSAATAYQDLIRDMELKCKK